MPDVDIIDLIDQVTTCGSCGTVLRPDGLSLDFCGEICADAWRARQADAHGSDTPADFTPVLTVTLDSIRELLTEHRRRWLPEPSTWRLTQQQFEQLIRSIPTRPDGSHFPDGTRLTADSSLFGIPIDIVDDVRESTPWQMRQPLAHSLMTGGPIGQENVEGAGVSSWCGPYPSMVERPVTSVVDHRARVQPSRRGVPADLVLIDDEPFPRVHEPMPGPWRSPDGQLTITCERRRDHHILRVFDGQHVTVHAYHSPLGQIPLVLPSVCRLHELDRRRADAVVCPIHGTPMWYWPGGHQYACQDPTCVHANGTAAEELARDTP